VTSRITDNSQRTYARFAGFMFLIVLGFDIGGVLIVSSIAGSGNFVEISHRVMESEQLYRFGLCCSLLGSISTIVLATGLYVTVKPVDGNLALLALLFRVVEAAIGSLGIIVGFTVLKIHLAANHANAFDPIQLSALATLDSGVATDVSATFFCLGSTIFFYLLLKSRYIPGLLSAWGIFASLLYLAFWLGSLILPQYSAMTVVYGSLPILVAELSTALWLLFVGIRTQPSEPAPVGTRIR
jgi:Domain of unknown function (DUF4386)